MCSCGIQIRTCLRVGMCFAAKSSAELRSSNSEACCSLLGSSSSCDCEMAKIDRVRCYTCDGFFKWNHFCNCNACGKSAPCHGCINTIHCSKCCQEFCDECKDFFHCDACGESFCCECNDEWLPCDECNGTFCHHDCKLMFICDKCDKSSCLECKDSFYTVTSVKRHSVTTAKIRSTVTSAESHFASSAKIRSPVKSATNRSVSTAKMANRVLVIRIDFKKRGL
jgi:hypothetical protein